VSPWLDQKESVSIYALSVSPCWRACCAVMEQIHFTFLLTKLTEVLLSASK
jgi:hypothetical protein